ncbi:MAG TPA: phosphopantetheine-binding protein, partial [Candidatus Methylomirabilis sp.]|nr:phosphopantetheine-binding protein [Candidatus Methylomirabilis sp.]
MDIAGKLKEILLQILDVKQDQIVPTAMFVEDLGATSLDVVEILTAIEN